MAQQARLPGLGPPQVLNALHHLAIAHNNSDTVSYTNLQPDTLRGINTGCTFTSSPAEGMRVCNNYLFRGE